MNTALQNYPTSLAITLSFGNDAATGDKAAQTQQAAGILASYMHQNGIENLDLNQLYKLAQNSSGNVPQEVSNAARFMLQNPDIYAKLETHDVAGHDGIAGVANFDYAARGGLDVGTPKITGGQHELNAETAAGPLAAYMHENGLRTLDPNALYRLAMNPGADTPPAVSAAAKFMLQHPDIYAKIETNDMAGADGISDVGNFDNAAQGKVSGIGGNAPAGNATLKMLQQLMDMMRALEMSNLAAQLAGGGAPSGSSALLQAFTQLLGQMLKGMLQGSSAQASGARQAAGALAAYMEQHPEMSAMTPDKLYKLAQGGGDVPPEVAKAARFMLEHPAIYKAIETHDVAGADGISGVGNFLDAAQGKIAGIGGKGADASSSAAQQIMQLLEALMAMERSGMTGANGMGAQNGLSPLLQAFIQLLQQMQKGQGNQPTPSSTTPTYTIPTNTTPTNTTPTDTTVTDTTPTTSPQSGPMTVVNATATLCEYLLQQAKQGNPISPTGLITASVLDKLAQGGADIPPEVVDAARFLQKNANVSLALGDKAPA